METTNDVTVTPFSLSHKKLNMIGSGSFNESGNSVTYEVNVEEAGLYYLTAWLLTKIKRKQSQK